MYLATRLGTCIILERGKGLTVIQNEVMYIRTTSIHVLHDVGTICWVKQLHNQNRKKYELYTYSDARDVFTAMV